MDDFPFHRLPREMKYEIATQPGMPALANASYRTITSLRPELREALELVTEDPSRFIQLATRDNLHQLAIELLELGYRPPQNVIKEVLEEALEYGYRLIIERIIERIPNSLEIIDQLPNSRRVTLDSNLLEYIHREIVPLKPGTNNWYLLIASRGAILDELPTEFRGEDFTLSLLNIVARAGVVDLSELLSHFRFDVTDYLSSAISNALRLDKIDQAERIISVYGYKLRPSRVSNIILRLIDKLTSADGRSRSDLQVDKLLQLIDSMAVEYDLYKFIRQSVDRETLGKLNLMAFNRRFDRLSKGVMSGHL